MIDLSSVSAAAGRIADIEQKIGLRRNVPGGPAGFEAVLRNEIRQKPNIKLQDNSAGRTVNESDFSQDVSVTPDEAVFARGGNVEPAFGPDATEAAKDSPGIDDAPDFMRTALSEASAERPEDENRGYSEMIAAASEKYGVDERLVAAVAKTESDFDQGVVSSAGAIGVMQLMPETARELGVNPYDAAENIDGGTRLLRQLLNTFDGNISNAVAAYNAGAGAVKKYGGVPPYRETASYVQRVLDIYQ